MITDPALQDLDKRIALNEQAKINVARVKAVDGLFSLYTERQNLQPDMQRKFWCNMRRFSNPALTWLEAGKGLYVVCHALTAGMAILEEQNIGKLHDYKHQQKITTIAEALPSQVLKYHDQHRGKYLDILANDVCNINHFSPVDEYLDEIYDYICLDKNLIDKNLK